MSLTQGSLHYMIIRHIIDHGYAPDPDQLAVILDTDKQEIEKTLYALRDDHGVVLHPHSTRIWVIHPFALAPTNFLVTSSRGHWWGNCAWCSFGVAALLGEDVAITTRFGGYDEQVTLHIENGKIRETDLLIHFPVPMQRAWDNVIYTCSTMLVFKNIAQVQEWSRRHHIATGDIQPAGHIWEFSRVWYGNHLSPEWKKWTVDEAKDIFARFQLTHPVWDLEASHTRF